jgi:Flp pilus assembly pilin Flp
MAARPRRRTRGIFSVAKQSSMFGHPGDESAQTMTEYAVILTLITLAIFVAVALLGTNIGSAITRVANLIVP